MTFKYDHLFFCVKTVANGKLKSRTPGHWVEQAKAVTVKGWKYCPIHKGVRLRQKSHHPKQQSKEAS